MTRMTRSVWMVMLSACAIGDVAHADTNADVVPPAPDEVPTARPVIPVDDTRSYGPTARDWVDLAVAPSLLFGRDGTVFELTSQVAVTFPTSNRREVRKIYDAYHLTDYQLRIRDEVFAGGAAPVGGPLTGAVQRYFPIAPLAISPLLYAHAGVEAAISTPWLSGRFVTPVRTIQVVDGVDSELAGNGWSLRPVAAYFRGDFLACRSASAEVGIEPEAFVPAVGANEYGTRFHVTGGCRSAATAT